MQITLYKKSIMISIMRDNSKLKLLSTKFRISIDLLDRSEKQIFKCFRNLKIEFCNFFQIKINK